VAVEVADEVEEIRGSHGASEQIIGSDGAADEGGGAPAQAAGGGDVVLLDEVKVDVELTHHLGDEPGGAVGWVLIGLAGDEVRPGAVDLHDRVRGTVEAYPHREGEREADRVITRA
jgi:hypothetical protein